MDQTVFHEYLSAVEKGTQTTEMKSLHDNDGWFELHQQVPSTDWEGRECQRCPKGHFLPLPAVGTGVRPGEFLCVMCRFKVGDLVLLDEPKEYRGYVCVVVKALYDRVHVRMLDDTDTSPENYYPYWGESVIGLVKTGKTNRDLAQFGPELCAQAIDTEMGMVDFLYHKRGGPKKAKVKKSIEELFAEGLVKLAKKSGKGGELMKILEE